VRKKIIVFMLVLVIACILTLSTVLNRSAELVQTTRVTAQQGNLLTTLTQDTPEHVLDNFYDNLLLKDYSTAMAPLFYQREHYTQMVSDAFYLKVRGYEDPPVYKRQPVTSSDYALYTITYTLMFKDINVPIPFLDVLPLVKQDDKWYIFIENPTSTPLEQAVAELYANPIYLQAEEDYTLQLQALLETYPDMVGILG